MAQQTLERVSRSWTTRRDEKRRRMQLIRSRMKGPILPKERIIEALETLIVSDLWDRVGVKVTSHMVGQAVEKHPDLAKEIVERGHEAAGHGQTWEPQYSMTPEQERAGYQASIDTIQRVTGTRPIGFNAFWLRGTPNTLGILQDLGFIYHIDDISRDEPFTVMVNGKPFAVVPYTIRNNDIVRFDSPATTNAAYLQDLKDDFDFLYAEAAAVVE